MQYQLKSEHISLAQVFSKMEQVVGVLGIEDYSVSQTTLDNVSARLWPLPAPPTAQTPSPISPSACQVFVNFAKKQSDNLEQQETESPSALQSPLGRLLSLFRPRPTPTELRALVADEPEDLDTEDEGLISFEEERVSRAPGWPEAPREWPPVLLLPLAQGDRETCLIHRTRVDMGITGTGKGHTLQTFKHVRTWGALRDRAKVGTGQKSCRHSSCQTGRAREEVGVGETTSHPGVGESRVPGATLRLACLPSNRPSSLSTRTRSADHQEPAQGQGRGHRSQAVAQSCPLPLLPVRRAPEWEPGLRASRPPPLTPLLSLSSALPVATVPPSPHCAKGWPGPGLRPAHPALP